MNRYRVTFLMFALLALIGLVSPQKFSESSVVAGQKRRLRRVPAPQATSNARIDYSRFSHATRKHQGACSTCHKVPTDNWKKVREFPDAADYPSHDACMSCHRPQFFKGAKPVICSVCHSKVSPRDEARLAFRNPAGRREFAVEFPHDKHQDVIARLFRRNQDEVRPLFQRASLTYSGFSADDKTKHYNNCEICHGPRTTPPVPQFNSWVDSFVPDAAAFRAVPTSHAACFNCHWKSQQPVSENCAGCHKSLSTNGSWLQSVNAKPPDSVPVVLLALRISLKFRHARAQHIEECTTCHINITKAATLRGLKPDVPITSCATSSCHNNPKTHEEIATELAQLGKDKQFVCSYCHTSNVGKLDPPTSHNLSVGVPPLKRMDLK